LGGAEGGCTPGLACPGPGNPGCCPGNPGGICPGPVCGNPGGLCPVPVPGLCPGPVPGGNPGKTCSYLTGPFSTFRLDSSKFNDYTSFCIYVHIIFYEPYAIR